MSAKHPVLACAHKGQSKRFFGKYKDPRTGVWKKIPGGPFSTAVDTKEKAFACAARWYEAEFVTRDAPVRIVTWAEACDAFISEVAARLRGAAATKDEARMKAQALRSSSILSSRPLREHDETLGLRWLRSFVVEEIPKNGGLARRDPLTVRNYVKVLREVYRFASRHGALSPSSTVPARGSEFDQELRALIGSKRKREVMLEPTTIAAVLEAPEVDDLRKLLVALQAYAGLRPGEAHGLRLSDIRTDARIRYLSIERQFKLRRKRTPRRMGPLKTLSSSRIIPIHRDLAERLDQWLKTGWAKRVGRTPTAEDVLLPNTVGEPFREDRAKEFRKVLLALDLPTTFRGIILTPYAARHTFSTIAKRVGIPQEDRDYLMGHSAKSTRGKHYDVSDLRHLYVQIRKLPTLTADGLKEHECRMTALDDIDEDELAPMG